MSTTRLLYRDFVVDADVLPRFAADAAAEVRVWTTQAGNVRVTDLSANADGSGALAKLLTDSAGNWAVYIPAGTTADDVLWFEVVGTNAGRMALGPASGFLTKGAADGAYALRPVVWQANTAYPQFAFVVNAGALYLALAAVPARATFTAGDWLAISGGGPVTPTLTVVDNGDGTATFSGASVTDNGNGTYSITDSAVTDNGDGTFTAAA